MFITLEYILRRVEILDTGLNEYSFRVIKFWETFHARTTWLAWTKGCQSWLLYAFDFGIGISLRGLSKVPESEVRRWQLGEWWRAWHLFQKQTLSLIGSWCINKTALSLLYLLVHDFSLWLPLTATFHFCSSDFSVVDQLVPSFSLLVFCSIGCSLNNCLICPTPSSRNAVGVRIAY